MSDSIPPNTSAGRLHLLIRAGSATQVNSNQNTEDSIGLVWAKVFNAPADDYPHLLSLHGKFLALFAEIDQDMHLAYGPHAETFVGFLYVLAEQIQQVSVSSNWSSLEQHFHPAVMSSLALTSAALSNFKQEEVIDQEQLDAWREQAGSLSDEIYNSAIAPEFRRELLRLLDSFLSAIQDYKITGSPGLEKEARTVFGAIILRKSSKESTKEEDEKMSEILGLAANVVTVLGYGIKFYNTIAQHNGWPQLPGGE